MGNPLFHWELMVDDVDATIEFYSKVFDWEFDREHFPHYPLVKTGDTPGGGILKRPEGVPMSSLNLYFHVEDMESTLARVTALGGTVVAPKMALPGLGFWAVFADPDGIPVGIMQMQ
jgi:uncharacterized protein